MDEHTDRTLPTHGIIQYAFVNISAHLTFLKGLAVKYHHERCIWLAELEHGGMNEEVER